MNENFLMSIAFSVFGMFLVFGLGFIFPTMNPYIVIKWIIMVSGAVFVYAVLSHFIGAFKMMKKSKKSKK